MKKWMLVAVVVVLVASLSGYAQAKYQAVPGKVTYYNETPRSKAPTEVKFWYTDDRNKREIGRLSVFNGDVYVFTPAGINTITKVARPTKPAYEPNFNSPSAVIADLERMKREAQAKKAQLAVVKCNYAITTIKNFMRLNPQGDPSILKQRWQEAYNEYKKIK